MDEIAKPEALCRNSSDTIKIPRYSKIISAKHKPNICSPAYVSSTIRQNIFRYNLFIYRRQFTVSKKNNLMIYRQIRNVENKVWCITHIPSLTCRINSFV